MLLSSLGITSRLLPIIVPLIGIFPLAWLLRRVVPGQDRSVRALGSLLLSVGLWICFFYLISVFRIPANHAALFMTAMMAAWVFKAGISLPRLPALFWLLCTVCVLPYMVGYALSGMLPGCDTAMHGYITRLIIEQRGLPLSYRPLLPMDQFGAYGSGFHFIAASCALFRPEWLMEGSSAATVVSHLVAVLGLTFLLTLFARPSTALVVAMAVFWFHRALQTVVDWGGTPTMLSLGLTFSALAFFGHAIRHRSVLYSIMGATVWSAAVLTHLIPAYTGGYLGLALIAYWVGVHRPGSRFLWKAAGSSALIALVWLMPFLLRLDGAGSPALSKLIREWQHRMMRDAITGDLPGDVLRLSEEVKFSLSDLTMIAVSACMLWMLYRRRYRRIGFVLGLSLVLFALIVNTAIWYLPFSELIYPERVMYFFVVPCGILMCSAAEDLACSPGARRGPAVPALAAVALITGCYNCFDRYVHALADPHRRYDAAMKEGFDWIGKHTPPDAVIHVAYDTEGMWVPALSYRAAVGTHLHFTHVAADVAGTMMGSSVDHYVLRTHGDRSAMDVEDPRGEMDQPVFKNGAVELVHTRRKR